MPDTRVLSVDGADGGVSALAGQQPVVLTDVRNRSLDRAAPILLFFFFFHIPSLTYAPLGAGLSVLLLPALLAHARVARRSTVILLAVAWGGLLTLTLGLSNPTSGVSPNWVVTAQVLIWFISLAAMAPVGAWALERVGLRKGLILASLGALASTLANYQTSDNPWKGTWGATVAMLVLSLAAARPLLGALLCVCLAALSAANDFRSLTFALLLAAVVAVLPAGARRGVSRNARASAVIALCLTPVFMSLALAAINAGYLGEKTRIRTEKQELVGGSIILGGRSEWASTLTLVDRRPLGYGTGGHPDYTDEAYAIDAARRVGGDVWSPYYSTVVFGPRVDLHSVLADLWFHYGVGGALLGLGVGLMLLVGVFRCFVFRERTALVFNFVLGLWSLLFSPMESADAVVLAVCLALWVRRRAVPTSRSGLARQTRSELPAGRAPHHAV